MSRRGAVVSAAGLVFVLGGVVVGGRSATVEAAFATGSDSSVVLDAGGNPVISYLDNTNADLVLLHCNDPACVGGDDIPVTVDASGDTGLWSSLVLDAAGNPVISYYDNTNRDLRLVHCNDPGCVGGDDVPVTVDASGETGFYTSLVLDAVGNPMISYQDSTNRDLRLVHCNDPGCVGGDDIPVTVDATGQTGLDSSLVLDAAGNPVISYFDNTLRDLRLVHCNDAGCVGGDDVPVTVDASGDTGRFPSLVLDAVGNPVISYHDSTNGHLRLVHCNDPTCVGGDDVPVTVDATVSTGQFSTLALDAVGNPVISYYDTTFGHLRLVHCNDPACVGGDDVPVTVDATVAADPYSSMVLDAVGNPVISYFDTTTGGVRLVHCSDAGCANDVTGPIATIKMATGQASLTKVKPVVFSVVFDEAVTGFEAADVMVTGTAGATVATVSGSGAEYAVTVSAIPNDGTVIVNIAAAAVIDLAGNNSLASVVVSNTVTIDTVGPVVSPSGTLLAATAPGSDMVLFTYAAGAIDNHDGPVGASCTPLSGNVFFVGDTTVTCHAGDSAGNNTVATFIVRICGNTGRRHHHNGGAGRAIAGDRHLVALAVDLVVGVARSRRHDGCRLTPPTPLRLLRLVAPTASQKTITPAPADGSQIQTWALCPSKA